MADTVGLRIGSAEPYSCPTSRREWAEFPGRQSRNRRDRTGRRCPTATRPPWALTPIALPKLYSPQDHSRDPVREHGMRGRGLW